LKVTDQLIWELSNKAISELGVNATPENIKKYVENEVMKLNSGSTDTTGEKVMGRIILTSFGLNRPGVVAKISTCLANLNCDLQDISQKIMQEFYTLIMMVDITNSPKNFREIHDELDKVAAELNVKIYIQHEDIFAYMFRI